jgi:hypothetical protein
MEKYSKILIYIFLFSIINSILIIVLFFKLGTSEVAQNIETNVATSIPKAKTTATPQPSPVSQQTDIKADLNLIKAELRALRESIDNSGVAISTPNP